MVKCQSDKDQTPGQCQTTVKFETSSLINYMYQNTIKIQGNFNKMGGLRRQMTRKNDEGYTKVGPFERKNLFTDISSITPLLYS